jgi:glycosyltransferase involved in cell wall biosynthesis
MIFCNAEKFMREAVESVFAQRHANWELLLVDDGSSDASTEMAQGYAARHPERVRYLEHPGHQNRGMSASRNLGIRHARGPYLAFLDADDVWQSTTKLEQQLAIFDTHPEAGMVCGTAQYWYSWTGNPRDADRDCVAPLGVRPRTLVQPPALASVLYPLGSGEPPGMSGILVRRNVARQVGGFEEQFRGLFEDQAFLLKVYLEVPVFVAGECWFRYRMHPESCCAIATRCGLYHSGLKFFLSWLEGFLSRREFRDPTTWRAYRRALFPYRHPVLWCLSPRRRVRQAKECLRRLFRWPLVLQIRGG